MSQIAALDSTINTDITNTECSIYNIHIYIYVCIYICVYMYIYMCVYMYIYIYVHMLGEGSGGGVVWGGSINVSWTRAAWTTYIFRPPPVQINVS